jgi:orotate phosphoribosyltransferase
LIIEDVTTSGGSVVEAIKILKNEDAIIDKVVVIVDRECGAKDKINNLGLELKPLINISEIIKN